MVKSPSPKAGDTCSIPVQRTKIPRILEQVSPVHATATEPAACSRESPCVFSFSTESKEPSCFNKDPVQQKQK